VARPRGARGGRGRRGLSDAWDRGAQAWAERVRADGDPQWEWNAPAFAELLPAPGRLTVDAGCGEGRLARELRARGHTVAGFDASPALVELARAADPTGVYEVADVTALPLGDGVADLVVSMNVLQHVRELEQAIREAARVLVSGGVFCVCVVHPLATGGTFGDDDSFVVSTYCGEVERRFPLGDGEVTHHHRPIETYVTALVDAGLVVDALREVPAQRRAGGAIPLYLHLRGRTRAS
jgi:SAM-dependent methyltransferase